AGIRDRYGSKSAAIGQVEAEVVNDLDLPVTDYALTTLAALAEVPHQTEQAAENLAQHLGASPQFKRITRPDALTYYKQNGLLFLSPDALAARAEELVAAQPLLATLAQQPSVGGLFHMLTLMAQGVEQGAADDARMARPLQTFSEIMRATVRGENNQLDWQKLMMGADDNYMPTRRFILAQPVLDFGQLQPARAARHIIHDTAVQLGLSAENGFKVRLTGAPAMNDDEFSSISDGMGVAFVVSLVLVVLLLWWGVRQWALMAAILITLVAGLIITLALGLLVVGQLNLISVAFVVMFVGIAVDFGIQFSVRFVHERAHTADMTHAMQRTFQAVASPLVLAGLTTAAGFLSFAPTVYVGVAELGVFAGLGMLVALALNLTLLPALIVLLKPSAQQDNATFAWLGVVEAWQKKHHHLLVRGIFVVALAAFSMAIMVRFDAD
ncbi:MAG: hopanoid biosynthesis-associated RND transporter HpnN, partial [Alphaproteobacteria bacterium]|nr:hopanoid biosynthesis-associated RND transporter HpnN [Alphaproteobacteria bacterium]